MKYLLVCFLLGAFAQAQSRVNSLPASQNNAGQVTPGHPDLLREFDSSLEQVVSKVSPAVVQILVSGYGPAETRGHTDTARIVRQHAIGSGVIVDPDGYIITNAHVIEGARRVRVVVSPASNSQLESSSDETPQIFEAQILGRHKNADLALIKIEATHLPFIRVRDDVRVRQGELVFAIGSPEGLRDSVTMGVVSSAARQTGNSDEMFYIQTDAPLNPGNSGGALVDIDGNVIGINTFMLSESGGNEGLGFAIPAAIVKFDYENLRRYGFVQRVTFGAKAQTITPTLAEGLVLPRRSGVIISNVVVAGFAFIAGIEVGDIVTSVDGRPINDLPSYMDALYRHPSDQALKITVLRGGTQLSLAVAVTVHGQSIDDLNDVPNLQRVFVPELSIFVTDLNDTLKPLLDQSDNDSGVVVIAQAGGSNAINTGVEPGDLIHALNRTPLQSVSQLDAAVHQLKSGDAVVLQIERQGKLQYLAFELD